MLAAVLPRNDIVVRSGLIGAATAERPSGSGRKAGAGLEALMDATAGRAEIIIALIDGPVAVEHPDFQRENMRYLDEGVGIDCHPSASACIHGTFVAGILHARRDAFFPGLCPQCTLIINPIFRGMKPSSSPDVLASAIVACVEAGARVINLSADMPDSQMLAHRGLQAALDLAGARDVILVAAAGNKPVLGGSLITRHCSVVPVVACDAKGAVLRSSNLGASIGRLGLAAPGQDIVSLAPSGGQAKFSGSSAAAAFVTGTVALLWSTFPRAGAAMIRRAVLGERHLRQALVPPRLDAHAAYASLRAMQRGHEQHERR
jgi:subtilisin family serine protease